MRARNICQSCLMKFDWKQINLGVKIPFLGAGICEYCGHHSILVSDEFFRKYTLPYEPPIFRPERTNIEYVLDFVASIQEFCLENVVLPSHLTQKLSDLLYELRNTVLDKNHVVGIAGEAIEPGDGVYMAEDRDGSNVFMKIKNENKSNK